MNTLDKYNTASLMRARNAIDEAHRQLSFITLDSHVSAEDDGGDELALHAFMEEREELKERIAYLEHEVLLAKAQIRQELDSSHLYTDSLRAEIDRLRGERNDCIDVANRLGEDMGQANKAFIQIADYARQLKERLGSIGINYSPDNVTGAPVVSVNVNVLEQAVRDMIDRS